MDEQTYADPQVIALIRSHYLAVKVDQDSRPDISDRYEDYGWPATVVFDSDGSEIVKRQGYLPPKLMASMLAGDHRRSVARAFDREGAADRAAAAQLGLTNGRAEETGAGRCATITTKRIAAGARCRSFSIGM